MNRSDANWTTVAGALVLAAMGCGNSVVSNDEGSSNAAAISDSPGQPLRAPGISSPEEGHLFVDPAIGVVWNGTRGSRFLIRLRDETNGGQIVAYNDDYRDVRLYTSLEPGHAYVFWVHSARENFNYNDPTSYGPASAVAFSAASSCPAPFPMYKQDQSTGTCTPSCGAAGGNLCLSAATGRAECNGIALESHDCGFCCKGTLVTDDPCPAPEPNYKKIGGRCVPSCGQAGGDFCLSAEFGESQCNGSYVESYDCGFCCQGSLN